MKKFLFAVVVGLAACSSSGKKVTVSGVVVNIDALKPAEGAKVYLLSDDSVTTATAVDSTGAFTLQVPKGAKLQLATDDFDSSVDHYFPLVNFDPTRLTADADVTG